MKRTKAPLALASEIRARLSERQLVTSTAIAKASGLGQSQVYRNLFGHPKTASKTLLALCNYAGVDAYEGYADPAQSQVLMSALGSIWDGSDAHARRLARLLLAHHRAHA